MHTLRSRLALVLLLCFVRVVLPDTWVLLLHSHQHTTEEARPLPRKKAVLTTQHQHCHAEHFYDVPFQPVSPLVFVALATSTTRAYTSAKRTVWASTPEYASFLRGPPVRA